MVQTIYEEEYWKADDARGLPFLGMRKKEEKLHTIDQSHDCLDPS